MKSIYNIFSKFALIATLLLVTSTAWGLSITSVRTLTDQVWVTFDETISQTSSDWTITDYQTNTQSFNRIQSFETTSSMYIRTSDGNQSVTKDNIYQIQYAGNCFLVTLKGYAYAADVTCTTCASTCVTDPTVTITSVTGGDGQLTVNWSYSNITPTSQTVQYKTASGSYQAGPSVAANATTATITGLTNDTEYTVKVTATDGTDSPYDEETGTPTAQVLLPVIVSGETYTHQGTDLLYVYITGYPNVTYPQDISKYGYENISGSTTITSCYNASTGYLSFQLSNTARSGERVYKITCSTNNSCAKLTFADGQNVPTVSACTIQPQTITFIQPSSIKSNLYIQSDGNISRIVIISSAAVTVLDQTLSTASSSVAVNVSNLAADTYTVKLYDTTGKTNMKIITAAY